MTTRRGFFSGLTWLAAGGGGAWLLYERVLRPPPTFEGDGSGWLAFAAAGSLLPIIAVQVNGRPVHALIDSGAQFTAVDQALATELALPTRWSPPMVAYGLGAGAQVARGVELALSLGGMTAPKLAAVTLSLGPLASLDETPVSLVLGRDVLTALAADFDFAARRVALHRAGGIEPPPGSTLALCRKVGGALHVTVMVEGRPVELLLDTGASSAVSTAQDSPLARTLLDGRRVQAAQAVVLGGVVDGGVLQAERLMLAGVTSRDVPVHLYPPRAAPGLPAGLLGVEAFRDRRAVLDLLAGSLHVSPPAPQRPAVRRRRR